MGQTRCFGVTIGCTGKGLQTSHLDCLLLSRREESTTVLSEALTAAKWVSDIQGALTVGVITEFLHLWDLILKFELRQGVNAIHFWRLAADKKYSAKVAYESFFLGSISFEPYQRIWKSWAPPKCRFFL
jgi:hypothetical protein